MANKKKTQIYVLLDRSGSMISIVSDVEGGFEAFVDEQKKAKGECLMSLSQFDDEYTPVYSNRDIAEVPTLSILPRGTTSLYDAMGKIITDADAEISALPKKDRPGAVIVAIMTDGKENSSKEWTSAGVKKLVEKKSKDGWQFLYMGADQNAIEEGGSVGIAPENSITYLRGNAREVIRSTSANVANFRNAVVSGDVTASVAYSDAQRLSATGKG